MATIKRIDGPTPAGGVRTEWIFADDRGSPADESLAASAEVTEYDADGRALRRTYMRILRAGGRPPAPPAPAVSFPPPEATPVTPPMIVLGEYLAGRGGGAAGRPDG